MIKKIDHLVITTSSPLACLDFYQGLGFTPKSTDGRHELYAGDFKINVHVLNHEFSPHATNVHPGSADLCFEIDGELEKFKNDIEKRGYSLHLGIVQRNGVKGAMSSIYLYDPDGNLIEFSSYS